MAHGWHVDFTNGVVDIAVDIAMLDTLGLSIDRVPSKAQVVLTLEGGDMTTAQALARSYPRVQRVYFDYGYVESANIDPTA